MDLVYSPSEMERMREYIAKLIRLDFRAHFYDHDPGPMADLLLVEKRLVTYMNNNTTAQDLLDLIPVKKAEKERELEEERERNEKEFWDAQERELLQTLVALDPILQWASAQKDTPLQPREAQGYRISIGQAGQRLQRIDQWEHVRKKD